MANLHDMHEHCDRCQAELEPGQIGLCGDCAPKSERPAPKLSPAQRRMLENIVAGRGWNAGLYGRSAHGGARGTVRVLRQRGLVDARMEATEAGRAMIVENVT